MYLAVRFSSLHTWRIASLLKMPWKMRESMMVEAMVSLSEAMGLSVRVPRCGALVR